MMNFGSKMINRTTYVAITARLVSSSSSAMYHHVPSFSFHQVPSSPPLEGVRTNLFSPSFGFPTPTAHLVHKTSHFPTANTVWLNRCQTQYFGARQIHKSPTCMFASPNGIDNTLSTESENTKKETVKSETSLKEDVQNIVTLIGAQGLLIPISMFLANVLKLPNQGLGESFLLSNTAFIQGTQWTTPLFVLAGIMKLIEPYSPALQDVTKATQRSVLSVMGSKRRPIFAVLVSILLGAVAGWGEEWLFRGVFQASLSTKLGNEVAALAISGLVFSLLHAVTPVYALLAGAASVFFGNLYNTSQNLAVPMVCHAVYDVGALLWAHFSVTALSKEEQQKILEGGPGAPILSTTTNDMV